MFKSATWRREKKIKAVFKMQFQATQVPKLKAKTLMISLVPADVGKPTVRLGKSSIVEGTCSWENPVYETVKLVKETKTGNYKGKFYHFIVSTGSSKAALLGEAYVDFVDFLEAVNPVMLSLPLEATNSGAILHVIVQRLDGTLDERYMQEDVNPTIEYYYGSLNMQLEESGNLENNSLEYTKGEQPKRITTHLCEQNISLSYTQTQSQDNIIRASQECKTTKAKTPEKASLDANVLGDNYKRSPGWSFEDSSDGSVIDTTKTPSEKYAMDKTELPTNDGGMNAQIKILERQTEVSEMELQSLRRHIAKESKKVQELSGRIVSLKQERDTLQTECEQLKTSLKSIQEQDVANNSLLTTENLSNISEEINQELCRQKHLNKKLKSQLQKTEDSNSELILAVRDLKEKLNLKNKELCHLSDKLNANQNEPKALADTYMFEMGRTEDTKEFKGTVREQNKSNEAELLKLELANLSNELELSKKEKEELKQHIQQLTLDYETVKKEKGDIYSDLQQKKIAIMEKQHEYSGSLTTMKQLKLQEESLKREFKKQALLYSESLATIDDLETEVKSLEKKLKQEAKDFQDKLTEVSEAKVEQEQRAIRAEEALRNANWSKTKMTELLREELRKKSEEMTSKINENEKLVMQALAEANEQQLQNEVLQQLLQKVNNELQLHENESKNHNQNSYRDPIQQKTGPVNEKIIYDSDPEENGKGEYTESGELENLDGSTAEIEFCEAQSKRNESHSRREVEMAKPHAYSISDLAKLTNEIASLKEGNKHMAVELKEMQERYSEISLKFAEVEGERQQLVMTLRNLRNGKKT